MPGGEEIRPQLTTLFAAKYRKGGGSTYLLITGTDKSAKCGGGGGMAYLQKTPQMSGRCSKSLGDEWLWKLGRWVAKLIARLLATAILCVPIQTSVKNTKWGI
jgi:hypothetical protein